MRAWKTAIVVASRLVASCSSEDDECRIDGTYTATGAVESGNCPISAEPVTDTFTPLPNGLVELNIQGLPGIRPVGRVNGCTWTAALTFEVTDATGPERTGTLQYSYAFTSNGFSGIVSQSIPPGVSLPAGCRGTAKVTGIRR